MSLEIITGGMMAGKSEELIKRVRREILAGRKVQIFKHTSDKAKNGIESREGKKLCAVSVKSGRELESLIERDAEVVAIDEAQFFEDDYFISVVLGLSFDCRIIVAGLDLDYQSKPFGVVSELMSYADKIDKLHAICCKCGKDASRSQRIVNGKPTTRDGARIMAGAEDIYEARCLNCFEYG